MVSSAGLLKTDLAPLGPDRARRTRAEADVRRRRTTHGKHVVADDIHLQLVAAGDVLLNKHGPPGSRYGREFAGLVHNPDTIAAPAVVGLHDELPLRGEGQ